jgi:EF hand
MDRPSPEAHRKMLLQKYDANKDGKLDDTELSALGRDVYEGKLPPPGRRLRGPGFGPQGRGGPYLPGFGPPGPDGPRGERPREFRPRGLRNDDGPMPPRDQIESRRDSGRDGGPEERRFGPGPRRFAGPSSEGRRKMLEERRHEFIRQYDVNGDGKLNATEREAIGKDIEDGKLLPPPLPPSARREMPPEDQ